MTTDRLRVENSLRARLPSSAPVSTSERNKNPLRQDTDDFLISAPVVKILAGTWQPIFLASALAKMASLAPRPPFLAGFPGH